MKYDPRATNHGLAASALTWKVDLVALAVMVGFAGDGVPTAGCFQQPITQESGVRLGEAKKRLKHAGFVASARVIRVQTVVAKLGDFQDGSITCGQLHA